MSFLSMLGKGLGIAGAVAGAPFTGGGSLAAIAPILGAAGSVLGGAAGGKADTTAAQTTFEQNRNRQLLDQFGIQQGAEMQRGGLDLQRKAFDESSEGSRFKRALVGNLLANMQDTNVSVPGITNATISGGLRPSTLDRGGGREIASEMMQRALSQARAGNTYEGGGMVAPPNLAAVPQQGGGFLDTAALVASLGGALGKPQQGQRDYTKLNLPGVEPVMMAGPGR